MSRIIDERVVEMRFDNRQFESNVRTSMSTLEKLKHSLRLDGVAKGFENITASSKKCDMSALSSAVDTVRVKFSALEVIAVTALANITNSALNASKQLLHSLAIEPISQGFGEYELKMGSIQTMLMSTGESLETVNQYLDELNTYADKTIYSFSDMTSNIGKFTNAGVGLKEAVRAIQGVSNVAAISGANANEASHAMYNFAQALSAGSVKLIDWKSIENANMATVEFKNELLKTAVALGTVTESNGQYVSTTVDLNGKVSDAFTATRNFNDSLSHQWMTTEVLVETLGRYADETTEIGKKAFSAAQDVKTFTQLMDTLKEAVGSGWATTWEIVFGDFNQAKELWTGISNVVGGFIDTQSKARNELLRGALSSNWEEVAGKVSDAGIAVDTFQQRLIETGKKHGKITDEMITDAGSFEKSLKSGWLTSDIFSETLKSFVGGLLETSDATKQVTANLEQFEGIVDRVINGDFGNGAARVEALTKVGYDYATIQGLVNQKLLGTEVQIENLSDAQLESIGYTDEQIQAIRELAEEAEKTGTPFNELVESLSRPSGRELLIDSFRNALGGLITILGSVRNAWRDVFPPMTSNQLYNIIAALHQFSQALVVSEDTADKLRRTFKGLFAIVDIFTTITGGVLKAAVTAITRLLGLMNIDILSVTANIGDAIVAVRDWIDEHNLLAKGLEKLIPLIVSFVQNAKQWIDAFIALPQVQNRIARFQQVLSNVLSGLKDYFGGGIEQIKAFIARIRSLDSINLDNIGDILRDFKENVVGYFITLGGRFDSFGAVLTAFKEKIIECFNSAKSSFQNFDSALSTFKDHIINHFSNLSGSFGSFLRKAVEFITALRAKFSEHIGLGEILTVGLGAGLIITIKKVGDALEVLSRPLELLFDISDNFNKMIGGCANALNGFATKVKSEALFNVAKSIATLVGAIALLTYLDAGRVWVAIGQLGILAGGLVAVCAAMGALEKVGSFKGTSLPIVGVAAALLILTTSLKQMEGLDSSKIGRSLGILGLLSAGLVAVAAVLSKTAPKLSSGALFFVSFAVSMKVLISALDDLGDLDADGIKKGLPVLVMALGSILALSLAFRSFKMKSGDLSLSDKLDGIGILATVVALKILISAIKDIANLDTSQISSNIEAFVAVFVAFAGVMAASKLAGENAAKAGVGILAMSAAILLIVVAIKQISSIAPLELERATVVVEKLLVVFAGIIAVSKFAGENAAKAGVMLLLMSGALLILSGVMVILSHLEPEGLNRALGAIIALEAVFGALIAVTHLAKDCKSTLVLLSVTIGILAIALGTLSMINPENLSAATKALSMVITAFSLLVASTNLAKKANSTLIVMILVVGALAGILATIAGLPIESTLSAAASLSTLLLALSASILIISKAGTIAPNALIAMGVMTLITAGLAAILASMSGMDVGSALGIAISLSTLLLSLSGACLILSGVGATGAAAFVGIGALMTLITAVGGLMIAVGALAENYPQMEEFMNKGLVLLEGVGKGIGAFLGNIVGGFLSGATSGLPELGQNLTAFMVSISPFLMMANTVDPAAMEGVKSIAQMILILTAADILQGLTSWLTGGSSIAKFADDIQPLGKAMVAFSQTVAGNIDAEAVTAAANAGRILAELASTLPNSGGLLGKLLGENELDAFAEKLQPFGQAMAAFSQNVAGKINVDAVNAAANAGKIMAELSKSIPNSGGVLGWLLGDNDIDKFAAKLVPFGIGMVSFSNTVAGKINVDAVTAAANAGQIMSELAGNIPNSGGLISFLVGDNDIAKFGKNLVSFGQDIAEFSGAVKNNVDSGAVTAAANAGKVLAQLENSLQKTGGLASWFSGDNSIATFGKNLKTFGNCFKEYAASVSGIDTNNLTGIVSSIKDLAGIAKDLNNVDMGGFKTFGSSMGKNIINGFKSSVKDTLGEVKKIGKQLSTTLESGVKSNNSKFNKVGKDAAQGFINGINAMLGSASTAGRRLGEAALNAAKEALDSHSPSREFIHLGKNIGEGLVIGIDNSIIPAAKATSGMISEVIAASKKGIKAFEDWIDERKYYGEVGLKEELAGWEQLQKMYKANSEERKKIDREVYRLQNELVEATYQYSIDWMEEEKYYNRLTLEQELAAWERVQSRYMEGSEQRKKADREVYRLKNELAEQSIELTEKTHQQSMDWIEEEKYYSRMSLSDELAAYLRVQKRYAKGTEQRKKMDREVYRLQKEISDAQKQYYEDVQNVHSETAQKRLELEQEYADKVKEINEKLEQDIQSVNDEYENALQSRADTLYQAYGLFDEVTSKDDVDGSSLMKNLEDQIFEFESWQDTLNSLSARGLNEELVGELQKMGPSAIAEIKALNKMSDSELNKYASLWSVKHALAREQAVDELEGLRTETYQKIQDLRTDSAKELDEYCALWNEKMEKLNADANRELEQLKKDFGEKVGIIKTDTEANLKQMADTSQAILRQAGWDETGEQIVTGITKGVTRQIPAFLRVITFVGLAGVKALKTVWDEHSPSRVFAQIGDYAGLGLINGLNSYVDKTYASGKDLANAAVKGLGNSIVRLSDIVDTNIDASPTICPVLDLSNVEKGAEEIGNLLYSQKSLGLAGQVGMQLNASAANVNGQTNITVDNSNVVREIQALRSDMTVLADTFRKLNIVMDTGALVGTLAAPMDAALGQGIIYKGRGI